MVAVSLAAVACVDNDPEIETFPDPDVDFTYSVSGEEYFVDYYVVSTIQFTNTSAKTGAVTWNFGDGNTSNEPNPLYKYDKAGLYNVTLSIAANDGKTYTKTYPILIYDIVPQLSIASQSDSIIEINKTTMSFNLALPNPEGLKVKYVWSFPEGTTDSEGNELTTFEGIGQIDANGEYAVEYPGEVKFKHIGSQRIDIQTWFDIEGENRQLEDAYLNVQVGSSIEAPTLYYAVKDGNIKALKLVDLEELPDGTKVFPYDMGVSSGAMPLNICYGSYDAGQFIYILDAGKQYYYTNDANSVLGDGKITAMGVDGSNVNTVISNEGQAAFMDPFCGYVYNGELYYSDRGNGVSKVALNVRGQKESQGSDVAFRGSYVFQNNCISYYNRGLGYGAITIGLLKDSKGDWWWGKNYSGNCIVRFSDSEIYSSQTEADAAFESNGKKLPHPLLLQGIKLRTFTIDEKRNALYVWRMEPTSSGFYRYDLPGDQDATSASKFTNFVKMAADPVNTTADEQVHTTQFALDEATGRVYFCFRADSGDDSGIGTGIVYYDPTTKKCESFGETKGEAGYGITINPTLSKLF